MKKIDLKFYHGLIIFALQVAVVLFIFTPVQERWGMAGLAATEIALLLIAVIPVIISGNELKEVFVFKGVRLRQIVSLVVFWGAATCLNALAAAVLMFFWPEYYGSILETNRFMSEFFGKIPLWAAFIIVAAMPAVCEEALHRGFIQYTMREIKNKWLIVLIMGVIFGIFHLDPIRFLSTALLGGVLAYIMVETGNLIIPMLFHFFNNAVSFLITMSSAEAAHSLEAAPDLSDMTQGLIGAYIIIGSFAPVLFYLADTLLQAKEYNAGRKPARKKVMIIALSANALLFIAGIVIIAGGL